jgi:AcrR family transcriptional regulator
LIDRSIKTDPAPAVCPPGDTGLELDVPVESASRVRLAGVGIARVPMNFDSLARTDTITEGVTELIRDGGMPAVTMRAIAAATGVSQASLAAHLGGRQHLLQVVASRFGELRVEDMEQRASHEGLLALLPACEDDVADVRVWLSWCDLGRTNEGVGHAVAAVEDREWWLVVDLLIRDRNAQSDEHHSLADSPMRRFARLDQAAADSVLATARDVLSIVHGVRHLVCAPRAALTPDGARDMALRLVAAAVPRANRADTPTQDVVPHS